VWNWNLRFGLDASNWTVSFYIDNVTDEKSPTQIQDFPLFDFSQGYQARGDIDTIDRGATVYPNAFSLYPRRSRNAGVVFQYRFGAAAL